VIYWKMTLAAGFVREVDTWDLSPDRMVVMGPQKASLRRSPHDVHPDGWRVEVQGKRQDDWVMLAFQTFADEAEARRHAVGRAKEGRG